MARYYLGKKSGDIYTPVSFEREDGKLLSALKYTASFNDPRSLKEDLREKNEIGKNDTLCYLIEKSDMYSPIYNGEAICYSDMKGLLDANQLLAYLKEQKFNYELFYYLFENLTNKYQHRENVPALKAMNYILNEIDFANRLGVEAYSMLNDKNDLDHLIFEFVLAAIGKYDRKKKQFDMENGKLVTSDRQFCDLLLLINNYFIIKRREQEYIEIEKNSHSLYEEYEKEEFLTDEDFISSNQDPDDYRHLIRN